MRFIRSNHRWRVVEAFSGLECCLEDLAAEKCYRVAGVCEALGVSQRHVYTIFMRDIGLPPKTWMNLERMVVARRMLLSGKSAEEVAKELGFLSVIAFRRKFYQVYRTSIARFISHPRLFDPDNPPAHFLEEGQVSKETSALRRPDN